MFLNILKNFLIKNKISQFLSNTPDNHSDGIIQSVGVIFDGNINLEIEKVINELAIKGIDKNQIKVLIFKNKMNKNEVIHHELITYKEFKWSGELTHSKAESFLNTNFDLLINYHEFDRSPLVYLSYYSKAYFKVGFKTNDKIINKFMVNTSIYNYQLFVDELLKYLKILNKI
ncbi:MAG: hypothetical protein EBR38_03700 [Flavobacteriaceae bacterium]|nr:hypothetical protein [Flavobacteriaceae bacterium]